MSPATQILHKTLLCITEYFCIAHSDIV